MKKCLLVLAVIILTSLALISCGGSSSKSSSSSSSSSTPKPSGLKFRAVVSQDVQSTIATPGLILIDALKDLRANVGLIGASSMAPAALFLSSDRKITVAVSIDQNRLMAAFFNFVECEQQFERIVRLLAAKISRVFKAPRWID